MKIFFLSLGCDKNLSDAEHMLQILRDAGHEFVDREEDADLFIVNTCAFIGDAKKESISEIFRLTAFGRKLILTGCLAERYQKEIRDAFPEVHGFVGVTAWDEIANVVSAVEAGERPSVFCAKDRLIHGTDRVLQPGAVSGYLKIAEGCNKHCAYCVIPKIRGPYRSYPVEELVSEAEKMAENGVRELILVAQETTVYGLDLYGKKTLPELLKKLAAIPAIRWIRVLYCYPEEITDELIEVLRTEKKVLPYLDLPIQHASDEVLRRMRRATTGKKIRETVKKLRKKVPGICLRTTLLTGFPGETEADFEALLAFVEEMRFDRLGVFPYSREEGTEGYHLHPAVPVRIRKKRRNAIMRRQKEISKEIARTFVGKTLEVLTEGRLGDDEAVYVGRTYRDAPDVDGYVFFSSKRELMSGDFVRVRITGSRDYDLIGEVLS